MEKNITIDAVMMGSRWEGLHGPQGLCNALMASTNAMMEMRLQMEYGNEFDGAEEGVRSNPETDHCLIRLAQITGHCIKVAETAPCEYSCGKAVT